MKINHVAVYVRDLEGVKGFYEKYFGGVANEKYSNLGTGLETYFLTFEGGSRLEIMMRGDIVERDKEGKYSGYIHLAFSVGSKEQVDLLTGRLARDGYAVISGPRITGDGYYESCVLDPEGNQIEIVV